MHRTTRTSSLTVRSRNTRSASFLRYGYKCYLFTEVDEFLVPDPELPSQGLGQYVADFVADDTRYSVLSTSDRLART